MKHLVTNVLLVTGIYFMTLSCVDHDIQHAIPVKGDYFPMTEGSRWEYVTKYHCPGEDGITVCYDTAEYFAKENAFYWDGYYQPLASVYGTLMWIKKANNEYFSLGAYMPEYKFLDTGLPLKGSWEYDDWWKRQFTIIAVNAEKTVHGINYSNVIGVLQTESWTTHNGELEETLRVYHYYAKDIGKIYSYYPEIPARDKGATEVFLINHFISQ